MLNISYTETELVFQGGRGEEKSRKNVNIQKTYTEVDFVFFYNNFISFTGVSLFFKNFGNIQFVTQIPISAPRLS